MSFSALGDDESRLDQMLNKSSSKIKDAIRKQKIGGELDLIDLNLDDILRLGIGFGIDVYQNEDQKTFSRSEKYQINNSITLKTPGAARMVSQIRKGAILEFVRQFEKQREALNLVKARPYMPAKAPVTLKKATELAARDYVKFNSQLALRIGVEAGMNAGILQVGGANSYIVHGEFQVEVYKSTQGKIRLRLSAIRKESQLAHLGLNNDYKLEVFAVKDLENGVKKKIKEKLNKEITKFFIPAQIVGAGQGFNEGQLLAWEYEITPSNSKDLHAAYDALLNPMHWKPREIVEILRDRSLKVHKTLSAHLDGLETLAKIPNSGIEKKLDGESLFKERRAHLNISLPMFKSYRGKSFLVQDLNFVDEDGKQKFYKLAELSIKRGFKFLKGLFKRDVRREANILFELDSSYGIKNFHQLNFRYERNEATHLNIERLKVQGDLNRMVPERYHPQIKLKKFAWNQLKRDVRIFAELILHSRGFLAIHSLTFQEMDEVRDDFLEKISGSQKLHAPGKYGLIPMQGPDDWATNAKKVMENIWPKLKNALSHESKLGNEERWSLLEGLTKHYFLQQIGTGLFSRLSDRGAKKMGLPFEELATYRIIVTAQGGSEVEYSFGENEGAEAYRKVLRFRDRIVGKKFDPRDYED